MPVNRTQSRLDFGSTVHPRTTYPGMWDAYGWPADEVPSEVEEDEILSRLLALNLERAAIA